MKSAIVTGASGFIGGALTERLLKDGVVVYGVVRASKSVEQFSKYPNFHAIVADFSQYRYLNEKISEPVDVFYHFAWEGVFGEKFKDYTLQLNNAIVACEAVDQAAKIGCKKFVLAGTCNEFEINQFLNSNDSKPRYTYIYSGAKTISEIICKTLAFNNGINYSAGLIAMAYGENNRSMMLPNVVISSLLKGQSPKLVKGEQLYDLIYIDDIIEAFIKIGEKGHNLKSYYVGHRKLKTFREIITEMGRIIDESIELKFGEYADTDKKDYTKIDLNSLYEDTGFECKADFKESVLRTAKWLKNEI